MKPLPFPQASPVALAYRAGLDGVHNIYVERLYAAWRLGCAARAMVEAKAAMKRLMSERVA